MDQSRECQSSKGRFEQAREAFPRIHESTQSASEAARELGIALSTFYKWKKQWNAVQGGWIAAERTEAAQRKSDRSDELQNRAVEVSLGNPTWGAKRISEWLNAQLGLQCSTGTVHAILKSNGISSREGRAIALYELYRSNKPLTRDQRAVLMQINPFAAWERGQASKAGEMLVQQNVPIPHSSPIGASQIMVIVDAFDQRAFAKFSDSQSGYGELEFLVQVVSWYRSMGIDVSSVVTNNGYQYHKHSYGGWGDKYDAFLAKNRISHKLDTLSTGGNRLNPLIKDVWSNLRNHLFKTMRAQCVEARGAHWRLNPLVSEYLERTFGG